MFKKVIFNKTALHILDHLSQRPMAALYEREIARGCKLSAGAVNNAMKPLREAGLVSAERRGKTVFYRPNLSNPVMKELKILFTLVRLAPIIQRLQPHAKRVILFGSAAQGTDTEHSDIDLFILTTADRKIVSSILHDTEVIIGKKINPVIVDAQRASAMRQSVLYQQIMKGKVLWDYHEPGI